jgi:hypothetical protein
VRFSFEENMQLATALDVPLAVGMGVGANLLEAR